MLHHVIVLTHKWKEIVKALLTAYQSAVCKIQEILNCQQKTVRNHILPVLAVNLDKKSQNTLIRASYLDCAVPVAYIVQTG